MRSLDAIRQEALVSLFKAFNEHDGPGVMSHMTSDVVFFAAGGTEICGRKIAGSSNVQVAFDAVWREMPDVSWECTRHQVFGNHAISEWVFRATTKAGQKIEVLGCDLFTFRGEKISEKSAFRKDRPPLQTA